jgi:hypothetical protein
LSFVVDRSRRRGVFRHFDFRRIGNAREFPFFLVRQLLSWPWRTRRRGGEGLVVRRSLRDCAGRREFLLLFAERNTHHAAGRRRWAALLGPLHAASASSRHGRYQLLVRGGRTERSSDGLGRERAARRGAGEAEGTDERRQTGEAGRERQAWD